VGDLVRTIIVDSTVTTHETIKSDW
jgi:hypothetical protein